jgi:YARHG domain-containing protein
MKSLITVTLSTLFLILPGAIVLAEDDYTCDGLWTKRNAIYHNHGYCFKTDRAIAVFGNEGCDKYSEAELHLEPWEQRLIGYLKNMERLGGCLR